MPGYVLRRLAMSAATLLVITAILYGAIRSLPGEPGGGAEESDRWLRETHALDSIPAGYLRWLADVARGDFGASLSVQPGRPVMELVAETLPFTLALGALSLLLTLGLAVPLGVMSAGRPDTIPSRAGAGMLYALHALPVFCVALALQHLVAGGLGWLPPIGAGPLDPPATLAAGLLARVPYWILPTVAITLGSLAFVVRLCRAGVLAGLRQDYVKAARARGAGESRVLWVHALSGGAVPLITLCGLMLPGIVSGSVLVETIFALPGVGRLFFTAAARRDYPLLMGIALLTAAATLAASHLADTLYRAADPRVGGEQAAADGEAV